MRIGINGRFYAARLTGVQRYARELTACLATRADAVLLLPSDAVPADEVRLPVMRGRLRGHGWEQLELSSLARAARCDVMLHPANTAPVSGGPHVVVVHDVLPASNPEWFTRPYAVWHRHVVRVAIRRAALVLTVSDWSAGEIERHCGVPARDIRVVTQGLAPFDGPAEPEFVRTITRGFNLPAAYVLMVGYADPRKNAGFLVSVIDELRRSVLPDLGLVLVGHAESRAHGRHTLQLPEWARVIHDVNDGELRALYTGAFALCFPSLAEGLGRPPLEALACGTPAIAASHGAAAETLGNREFVIPLERARWAAALHRLASEPGLRAQLVHEARPRLQRFDWGVAADQVVAACAGVLEARTAKAIA